MPVSDHINRIQVLSGDQMVITESGYLEVFAYNNAQTPVFFDNIELRHTSGPVLEENHYYPFGMLMDMSYMPVAVNERNFYKYNNKELQTEHNLGWLDYGARMLDPTIGRWMVPDPLAEKGYQFSPYVYCAGNPVRFIDPDGKWFKDKILKWVNRLERKIDEKIDETKKEIELLTENKQDTDDAFAQLGELYQSQADIRWMKADTKTEYRYVNYSSKENKEGMPHIDTDTPGVATMYVQEGGNEIHETRHGGDFARGTLRKKTYKVQHEVSAYKAQYAFEGKLSYIDVSNSSNQQEARDGLIPSSSTISDINQITPDFVITKLGYLRPVKSDNKKRYILTPLYNKLK